MARLDTFLFDLDGTLVDSVGDIATSINLLRGECSLPPLDRSTIAGFIGDGAHLLVQRALPADLYCEARLHRLLDIYRSHLADETVPFAGILPFLEACDDRSLAVVTNKPLSLSEDLLDRLNLTRFFPVVVGGDSIAAKKPEPEPVLLALERLGRSPENAVMIGDHSNDLRAGRSAGTRTCFCAWGIGGHGEAHRDYEAEHPSDLQKLLLA